MQLSQKTYVFSNYDKKNPALAPYWALSVQQVLDSAFDPKTQMKISPCASAGKNESAAWDFTYPRNMEPNGHLSDCCGSGCRYGGLLYGNGLDVSIDYSWGCNINT
jgi:hypothetical protein